jgi:hypothetical protein
LAITQQGNRPGLHHGNFVVRILPEPPTAAQLILSQGDLLTAYLPA